MRSHPAMTADVMIIFAMIFVVRLVISLRRRLKIARAVRVLTYASMRPGVQRHQPVADFGNAAGGLPSSPAPFVGSVLNFITY